MLCGPPDQAGVVSHRGMKNRLGAGAKTVISVQTQDKQFSLKCAESIRPERNHGYTCAKLLMQAHLSIACDAFVNARVLGFVFI